MDPNTRFLTRNSRAKTGTLHDPLEMYRDDETGELHEETVWKLDVGEECNQALHLAELIEQGKVGPFEGLRATANSIAENLRSLVARVAEFEDLETE